MKICFYNLTAGFKSGGLETYCWEVGRALARQGHDVHILGGEGGQMRNDEVNLVALPYTPRDRFPNLGTRFRKLAERLSFAKYAKPVLYAGNYDAVIVNKPYDFPVLSWLKSRGYEGVTAIRSGGTDFYFGDRHFAKAVDVWLSTSKYNAAQIEARYGRPVTVIPNGVDPVKFFSNPEARRSVRDRFHIALTTPVIISVGRLVGWKGLDTVLRALPRLQGWTYLVVGHGDEHPDLVRLSRKLGVEDRVRFVGEIAHSELPGILSAADVFVQPSLGEEAFGISVVEAMACALPTLVSDQGGLREIVQDGKTGRLLPPGNVDAWTAALIELAPANVRQVLGASGRSRVLENFTWESNAGRLVSSLKKGRDGAGAKL